jgi:hypothetical protein
MSDLEAQSLSPDHDSSTAGSEEYHGYERGADANLHGHEPDDDTSYRHAQRDEATQVVVDPFGELAAVLEGNPRAEEVLEQLRTLSAERDELGSALDGYEPYEAWLPAIDALAEQFGATPEMVLEYLQNPEQLQPTPSDQDPAAERQQRLEQFLTERGVEDPRLLTNAEQATLGELFEMREWRHAQEQQQLAWMEQQREAEIAGRLQRVHQEYPEFQSSRFTNALRVFAEVGLDPIECAHDLRAEIETILQSELARYYDAKQRDGDVPVVPGGASPLPRDAPNYHELPEPDRREVISQFLRAAQAQV